MGKMLIEGADAVIALSGDGEITLRGHGCNDSQSVPYGWREHAFGGDCVYALQRAAAALRGEGPLENTATDYLVNIAIEEAL